MTADIAMPELNDDSRSSSQPHALYRFYDAQDRLLYVGISTDIGARWKHHSREKEWWRDVTRATIEHLESREAALAAEAAAIRIERPAWNIAGMPVAARAPGPQAREMTGVDDRAWPGPGEVVKLTGLGRTTLHRLLENGTIGYTRSPGGHRRCNPDDVRKVLGELEREHRGEQEPT